MYNRPACRYRVTIGEEDVRIVLQEPSAITDGRRTYRFVAPVAVESAVPDDTAVTVDGCSLSIESGTATELTVTHDATSTPVEDITGYHLAFENDAPATDVTVGASGPIVATETSSDVPYRRERTDEGVRYRGTGPVELVVAVAPTTLSDRVSHERDELRYDISDADSPDGTPVVPLSAPAYEAQFGVSQPVTRLNGVAYLNEAALTSTSRTGDPRYRHGERCTVRPPGRFEDAFDDAEAGRYAVVDRNLARLLGCDEGTQILMRAAGGRSALFTVATAVEQPGVTVRLTGAGRERLDVDDDVFDASVTPVVADPTLSRDEARRDGGVIERLRDTSDDVVICAPHGGAVERNTDMQARRLATRFPTGRPSTWVCEGWTSDGDAFDRFHVRSSELSPRSFPLLSRIADRGFDYAVSFHCHDNDGIVVGGRAPLEIRQQVADAILEAVADDGVDVRLEGEYMGERPENFVNWLTEDGDSGIQIEQSPYVVKYRWRAVADAIATAFEAIEGA